MKPRPIGIVSGGGGPIGSVSILRDIVTECQKKYGSARSYEYPCVNFYSYPYSEMLLVNNNSSGIPSRELAYCIQQLKLIGMEIIVVPCFTMGSYLTYRNYGVELIEMGPIMQQYLKKNAISNPMVLCSERTRKSNYCDRYFSCQYPTESLQKEVSFFLEEALKGEKINIKPLLDKLPKDVPIVCAATTLNAQMEDMDHPRLINPNKVLVQHVVQRSYEGTFGDNVNRESGFIDIQREAAALSMQC